MLSWSLKHLVHPAANLTTGFLTEIGELSRLQWRTRDEINRRVLKRLRFVISHACENFRFYHDMLKTAGLRPREIDSFEEFRRIPTVNKSMMARLLRQEGVSSPSHHTLTYTGGTTGRPLAFLTDRDAGFAGMISKVFFDGWIGVAPYEKKFKIAPAEPWFGSWLKDRLLLNEPRATFFSVMSDTSGVCKRFLSFKPKLVSGGTAFRMLADFMANKRVGGSEWLRGVAVWGMPLLPDDTRTISKGFCDNIYDRYGSAELSGSVAQQCHVKTGLHVNTELSFIEVLKGNEPCHQGERGRIVITNLRNLATPFIRYEQEDTAVPLDDCPCGRRLPMIYAIRGEGKDVSPIQMRDGIRIPQATLHTFLRTLRESEHVEQFSFSKPSSEELLLTIHPGHGFRAQSAERIHAKLSEAIGSLAAVSVKIGDDGEARDESS